MSTLLSCSTYKEIFRTPSGLKNHVKNLHQSTIKVRLADGKVREITKLVDSGFKCECGKTFQHTSSIFRHAKQCYGVMTEEDNGVTMEKENGVTIDKENGVTTDKENGVTTEEELTDCIGNNSRRLC